MAIFPSRLVVLSIMAFLVTGPGARFVLSAPAALPRDVPAHHWAAPAVRSVVGKKLMQTKAKQQFRGDDVVTRYELAVTLDRFARYIENSRKPLTPGKEVLQPVLPQTASPEVKKALNHLVAANFIPVDSPLVTKPGNEPVTPNELAEAMAQVSARLIDRGLPPTRYDWPKR